MEPNTTRITAFFRHISHHRTIQHLQHYSLQKAYTHRPILPLDSNHHIIAKQSVFNTLAHRAKTVSSTQTKWTKNYTTSNQHSTLPVSCLGPQPVATQVQTTPTRNKPPPPAPSTTTTPQTTMLWPVFIYCIVDTIRK